MCSITNKSFLWKQRSMSSFAFLMPVPGFRAHHSMEDIATHFLLRLIPSLTPIGTIRVYKNPGASYYKLSRLAVLKDYRKYSFGRTLVLALHDWVKATAQQAGEVRPVQIVAHSQIYVKGFYAKFGYEPEGDEFDEEGDPHQKMVLRLPLQP
ncbi:acyl-CoA N-acyltransferase [Cyathus striatus]|nr:acyl-CoA N-acyltransferase [Cyathus striatus]